MRKIFCLACLAFSMLPAVCWGSDFPTASTEDVVALVGKGGGVLVDARHPDIFNGWALNGLPRGGHIEGATDFAYTLSESASGLARPPGGNGACLCPAGP